MYYSTQQFDLDISFKTASVVRMAQVFGLGFLFVPITLVSYVGMPLEKSNSIAGLVNFMRNIGSGIGTSLVTTLIARQAQFHQVSLVAHITPGQSTFTQGATALAARLATSGLDASRATRQAYDRIYHAVIAQATTLAYIDTFWVLTLGSAVMFVLSFLLKRNEPGGGGDVAVG
jgi:DHA2 family multidrug resistance protein